MFAEYMIPSGQSLLFQFGVWAVRVLPRQKEKYDDNASTQSSKLTAGNGEGITKKSPNRRTGGEYIIGSPQFQQRHT